MLGLIKLIFCLVFDLFRSRATRVLWFIRKAVPESQHRISEKLVAAAPVTVDRTLHKGEVSVGHSDDIGRAQIGSVGERSKSSQIHQQNRNDSLVSVEGVGEAAAGQCHEPCWRQIGAQRFGTGF